MRLSVLALALASLAPACGGSSSSSSSTGPGGATGTTPPPEAAPVLLGKPVWNEPLRDPMALRALERVRAVLADVPPTLQGTDPRMWLGPVQTWIERRVKVTRELRADADALASDADPRMQLLATVVFSVAGDDLISDLLSLQPPPEVVNGEFGIETKAAFLEALETQAAPVATITRGALRKCIVAAPAAPESLRVWEAYCRERDTDLAELEARVAARATRVRQPAKPPAMFADCVTQEVRHSDPDAPPADRKAKPVVAYIYDGTQVTGADARKLEQAVAAKLGGTVGMPIVDAKQLASARALVAQRKLHARAPVCGQAPPLPAVIAHTKKHVIVGEISTTCIYYGSSPSQQNKRCGLTVEYTRAGSKERDGLPTPAFAKVDSLEVPAAEWLAAADRLAPDEGSAALLGGLGGSFANNFFEIANYSDDAPWLRVASTLGDETRTRIAACVDAPASFDATFTIARNGTTGNVALAPITAPPADSKVAACVKKALETTPWPCPLDGKPAKVAVRMCVAPRS